MWSKIETLMRISRSEINSNFSRYLTPEAAIVITVSDLYTYTSVKLINMYLTSMYLYIY